MERYKFRASQVVRDVKQGHTSRCTDPEGAEVWAKAIEGMVDEHVKFALNSAVDTLPHNANLALWGEK